MEDNKLVPQSVYLPTLNEKLLKTMKSCHIKYAIGAYEQAANECETTNNH